MAFWLKYDIDTPLPKSETQEALEKGCALKENYRIIAKKQLNFQSYPMKESSETIVFKDNLYQNTSSYKRDYPVPYPNICKPLQPKDNEPDLHFFRRSKNDFVMLPSSSHKFMDDGLYNRSDIRRKIDFFRQIRNFSSVFGESASFRKEI